MDKTVVSQIGVGPNSAWRGCSHRGQHRRL